MSFLPHIDTRDELADLLRIPLKKLTHLLYVEGVDNLYRSFDIPKKSGGERHINAPTDELKGIQRKLADALWEHQADIWRNKNIKPNISHAFEQGKSIITNAKIHKNKRYVLNMDLENFFDTFHFGRVRGFFEKNNNFKLPIEMATVIAQLACYQGCLPQGAPSSPIITNLICQILDNRLLKIAKSYKLDYSRYADDITFSTNNKEFIAQSPIFIEELTKEIERAGFKINNKKTKLQYRDSRQEVTGLVVNKKISVDRRYYKATRAMAHSLYSTGSFEIDGEVGTTNQLEGRFSFLNQIERHNNKTDRKDHHSGNLNAREEQYRKFLFYKYFFMNDKPLIVTEGKTDIAYIKAALKNLYADYPDLISKVGPSEFTFKVTFLRRTQRLRYFFGLGLDGADTIKRIYYFYRGVYENGNKHPNYAEYFERISGVQSKNPTIFLFDNEISNKEKPLSKFLTAIRIKDNHKADLQKNLYINITGNLYLLTNPIPDTCKEAEIEDLFDDSTRAHVIAGKKFSPDGSFDNSLYYGKEIFSKYIFGNYETIDFSGFKPLLDSLNTIAKEYGKQHSPI